jgi:hypothetical protein
VNSAWSATASLLTTDNNRVPPSLAALAPEDMAPVPCARLARNGVVGQTGAVNWICGGPRRHPKDVI